MHNQEIRRIPQNTIKQIPSSNSLLSGKDRKKIEKSKQKENQKKQKFRQVRQIKDGQARKTILNPKQHQQYLPQQYDSKKTANGINFKNLKNGLNKKIINTNTNNNQIPNNTIQNKQIYRVISNQPQQSQQPQISINVSIQNMISAKKTIKSNISEINSQRSSSLVKGQKNIQDQKNIKNQNKGNKKKIINNNNSIDDFQCDQQLEFTNKNGQTGAINTSRLERKVSDKKPLISYPQRSQTLPNTNTNLTKPDYQTISTNIMKPKHQISPVQELRQFQKIQQQINIQNQTQMISYIDLRQQAYTVDPAYIEKKQKNFKWIMRAILMDWMMHVTSQFSLKRDTYHIAVMITDNFMAKAPNLPKSDFQLVGATAMFIASKLEEFECLSSKQFAKSTSGRYTANQIKQMQQKICKTLKFNLNPPTIYMWANRIMTQWDQYIQLSQTAKNHPLFHHQQSRQQFFKKPQTQAYKNYRQLMQLIDCAMLDIQSVQYRPQLLVCSFMYLVLGKQLNQFDVKQIATQFPKCSLYLLDQSNWYNDFFKNFVQQSFGFLLYDLLPTVQYSATYFILPIMIDKPTLRNQQQILQEMNLQEYCSYQTYNNSMLQTIKKRQRGIYGHQYQ